MKYTHVIWDFNGTLISDMNAGMVSVNKMLSDRGLPEIKSIEEYREVFKFPIEKYYADLGFDFEIEPYSVLAPIWVELYNSNSHLVGLNEGIEAALAKIKDLGIRQTVLSASEIGMLERQLDELGIRNYFDEVIGLGNIHAASKISLAREWKGRNSDAVPLVIGDTEHDAETAREICADCVLFSGGHQSRRRLEAYGYPLVDKIEDVFDYL